jgi:hypothetical protein
MPSECVHIQRSKATPHVLFVMEMVAARPFSWVEEAGSERGWSGGVSPLHEASARELPKRSEYSHLQLQLRMVEAFPAMSLLCAGRTSL